MLAPFLSWPCVGKKGELNFCIIVKDELYSLNDTEYQRTRIAIKRLKIKN